MVIAGRVEEHRLKRSGRRLDASERTGATTGRPNAVEVGASAERAEHHQRGRSADLHENPQYPLLARKSRRPAPRALGNVAMLTIRQAALTVEDAATRRVPGATEDPTSKREGAKP
jgi:hypothetical protein